jgi:hypothetical protein
MRVPTTNYACGYNRGNNKCTQKFYCRNITVSVRYEVIIALIMKSAVPPNSGAVVLRRNSDVSGGIYRPL